MLPLSPLETHVYTLLAEFCHTRCQPARQELLGGVPCLAQGHVLSGGARDLTYRSLDGYSTSSATPSFKQHLAFTSLCEHGIESYAH